MKSSKHKLSLVDMDIGLFVSYELNAGVLITKLFHFITLNRIPLRNIKDLREANLQDVTSLNWINWFRLHHTRKYFAPFYTLQAAENQPRIFMKLDKGSHIEMKIAIGSMHEN